MHPEIDRYAGLDSPIHRWNPPQKLVGFGVFIFALAFVRHLGPALLGLLVAAALAALSRIPLAFVLVRLRWIALFLAPLLVLLPLEIRLNGGAGRGVAWSPEAARSALVLVVRALAIALVTFPMWGTSPFHHSLRALQSLGAPPALVQMVLFSYRYLFVHLDQMRKRHIAMVARGWRPGLTGRSLRAYGHQVGMLLVGSYEQTERLLAAMRSRGYEGEIRTLARPRSARADWLKLAGLALASLVLLGVDHPWAS